MRRLILRMLVCLLALGGLAVQSADAAQRTRIRKVKGDRPDADKAYELKDILKAPMEFQDREVLFYARFATTANLFKTINTRFNANNHVNFAVWPDKTPLWETEGRKTILPTLYIAKNEPELLETLHQVNRYELIAITGTVMNVYAGYPWLLVTNIERIEKPYERLSNQVIEHMQAGNLALKAGNGDTAARHYEQALQFGLPNEYRPKIYEQLAQAYLLDNRLDRARGYLRQAVQMDRTDPVLHLALADVALQMEDPGEAMAHAQFALERSGKYPQAYGIKGEALSLLGDYAKAFTELNTAAGTPGISAREKAVVNMRRARIYARSDRYADAARVYAAISEPGEPLSTDPKLHNEIGLFYEKLFLESGDERYLESASTAFGEAARLASLNPSYLYNQAEVEFRRQRLAETPDMGKVSDVLEKIFQIDPDYPPARVLQGRVLFQEGKSEEAERIFQLVSPHLGSHATALLALSEAYIDLGRYDDAHTAITHARQAEPWNKRIQALGQFLEDVAASLAATVNQHPAFGGYMDGGRRTYQPSPETGGQAPSVETLERPDDGENVHYNGLSPEEQAYYRMRGPRGMNQGAQPGRNKDAPVVRSIQPRPAQPRETEIESRPAPTSLAAARKMFPGATAGSLRPPAEPPANPTMAKARLLGVTSGGQAGGGAVRFPQDTQTSVRPFLPDEDADQTTRARFPVTKVRLPDDVLPAASRKAGREPEAGEGTPPATETRESGPERRDDLEPLNLGYTPGGGGLLDSRPIQAGSLTGAAIRELGDDFDQDFGRDYQWPGEEREIGVDDEGYIRFGMIRDATNAYASLPAGGGEGKARPEAEEARLPPAFSFEPDTSPVIIADVRSRAVVGRDAPARNANVYKTFAGGRRPAEIIEHEPIAPRLDGDASAMTPPSGGGRPRAEIRLPSSSQGVGTVSDYVPAR